MGAGDIDPVMVAEAHIAHRKNMWGKIAGFLGFAGATAGVSTFVVANNLLGFGSIAVTSSGALAAGVAGSSLILPILATAAVALVAGLIAGKLFGLIGRALGGIGADKTIAAAQQRSAEIAVVQDQGMQKNQFSGMSPEVQDAMYQNAALEAQLNNAKNQQVIRPRTAAEMARRGAIMDGDMPAMMPQTTR